MTRRHSRDCRELIEQLSRLIDDDLSGVERRAVMRHLRRCPCCGDFVASLRHTACVCREAGHATLPRAVRARAVARIRRLLAHSGSPARPRRSRRT